MIPNFYKDINNNGFILFTNKLSARTVSGYVFNIQHGVIGKYMHSIDFNDFEPIQSFSELEFNEKYISRLFSLKEELVDEFKKVINDYLLFILEDENLNFPEISFKNGIFKSKHFSIKVNSIEAIFFKDHTKTDILFKNGYVKDYPFTEKEFLYFQEILDDNEVI